MESSRSGGGTVSLIVVVDGVAVITLTHGQGSDCNKTGSYDGISAVLTAENTSESGTCYEYEHGGGDSGPWHKNNTKFEASVTIPTGFYVTETDYWGFGLHEERADGSEIIWQYDTEQYHNKEKRQIWTNGWKTGGTWNWQDEGWGYVCYCKEDEPCPTKTLSNGDASYTVTMQRRYAQKVIYDMNGGNINGSTAELVEYYNWGQVMKANTAKPTRDGYQFIGWAWYVHDGWIITELGNKDGSEYDLAPGLISANNCGSGPSWRGTVQRRDENQRGFYISGRGTSDAYEGLLIADHDRSSTDWSAQLTTRVYALWRKYTDLLVRGRNNPQALVLSSDGKLMIDN